MRMPKWTEEETDAHGQWRLNAANHASENAGDREEFFFCLDYYLSTPEGKRRADDAERRLDNRFRLLWQQADEVADAVLAMDDSPIIATLRDSTQSLWVKQGIVWSYRYSHSVLNTILSGDCSAFCWIALGHPAITLDDLKLVLANPHCSENVRITAQDLTNQILADTRLSA